MKSVGRYSRLTEILPEGCRTDPGPGRNKGLHDRKEVFSAKGKLQCSPFYARKYIPMVSYVSAVDSALLLAFWLTRRLTHPSSYSSEESE